MTYHRPVLLSESLSLLDPAPGKIYLDATLGHAGHTLELLRKGATVYGLDYDPTNQKIAIDRIESENLSTNFHPIIGNFSKIFPLWQKNIGQPLDGLLLDLGLSVNQQSLPGRGFSFTDPDSLDMRLNPQKQKITAENIINTWDRDQLYQLFTKYSQEKLSRPLVYEIIKARQQSPIKSGQKLAEIISQYYQKKHYRSRHHPATQIFMALRIAVNQEFSHLNQALKSSLKILKPGAPAVIISFHSGEDRLVKNFISLKHLSSTRILPSTDEIKNNPLSRSAVLRCFQASHD